MTDGRASAERANCLAAEEDAPPPATEGLNKLDQDRAASVADEGGATAATVEAQTPTDIEKPDLRGQRKVSRTRTRASRSPLEIGAEKTP